MFRLMCVGATSFYFVLLAVGVGFSQDVDFTGGMQTRDPDNPDMIYRKIIIRPKRASSEKHVQLYPSQDQRTPGTAAPVFLRSNFEAQGEVNLRNQIRNQRIIDQPLAQLDVDALRSQIPIRINELRRAAFRERAGWEYPIHEQELAEILLPDVQESRGICETLAVVARADIKVGELEAAYDKLAIGYGLASHVGETPFLVCKAVQAAHAGILSVATIEAMQHPDGENLYWALVALPRPFVDMRPAIQMERRFWKSSIPELGQWDLVKDAHGWERLLDRIIDLLPMMSAGDWNLNAEQIQAAKTDLIRRAKIRLAILDPQIAEKTSSMTDSEQAVRYWYVRVQQRIERQISISQLEPHQSLPLLIAENERAAAEYRDEPLVAQASFSMENAVRTSARTQQLINLMQAVESIRDWSSRNNNQLPGSLDDLELPVSPDPMNNQPFIFTLRADNRSATLEGSVYRFELTLP